MPQHQPAPLDELLAFAQSYDEHLNAYEGLIHAVSLERGIKHAIGIIVDEWNAGRSALRSNDPIISVNVDEWGVTRLPEGNKDEWGAMRLPAGNRNIHRPEARRINTVVTIIMR